MKNKNYKFKEIEKIKIIKKTIKLNFFQSIALLKNNTRKINCYLILWLIFSFMLAKTQAQPELLLLQTLGPQVQFDHQQNLVCTGRMYVTGSPIVAQKVDQNLKFLWPGNEFGVRLTNPTTWNDETRGAIMFLLEDGSAIFACQYMQYLGISEPNERTPETEILYRNYPILQRVSRDGQICWGENGVCLSDTNIICTDWSGFVDFKNLSRDADGCIDLIWTWSAAENVSRTEIIIGTFMQKVNPITGDILMGRTGQKILAKNASFILQGEKSSVFIFIMSGKNNAVHEIIKFDKSDGIEWLLNWNPDLFYYTSVKAIVTNNNDLYLLYITKDKKLKSSLISADGEVLFQDRVISSNYYRIQWWSPLIQWGDDQWILLTKNSLFYFNTAGEQLWGDAGIVLEPDKSVIVADIEILNDETLLVLYATLLDSVSYTRTLKMQKIARNGALQWDVNGVELIQNTGAISYILPDKQGGAFIVTEAFPVYEPFIQPRGTYMMHVDQHGNFTTSIDGKNSNDIKIPDHFSIVRAHPNPFTDQIKFSIQNINNAGKHPVTLTIYNLLGKEVVHFDCNSPNSTGANDVIWHGVDRFGNRVSPGLYFYRVTNESKILGTGKLILIH